MSFHLKVTLTVHLMAITLLGLVGSLSPSSLLVYGTEEQYSSCIDCALAMDLAESFGIINLFVASVIFRLLLRLRVSKFLTMKDEKYTLFCLACFMTLVTVSRLRMISTGNFSQVEWSSVFMSIWFGTSYTLAFGSL